MKHCHQKIAFYETLKQNMLNTFFEKKYVMKHCFKTYVMKH